MVNKIVGSCRESVGIGLRISPFEAFEPNFLLSWNRFLNEKIFSSSTSWSGLELLNVIEFFLWILSNLTELVMVSESVLLKLFTLKVSSPSFELRLML